LDGRGRGAGGVVVRAHAGPIAAELVHADARAAAHVEDELRASVEEASAA